MSGNKQAYFAGGCFWCTEAIYKKLDGVINVTPGYSGGSLRNPTYKEVCAGNTGHAESIKIEYDPELISFELLVEIFFSTHDPTTLNRQGNDVGTHYRSAIFFNDLNEKNIVKAYIQKLENETYESTKIVTELKEFEIFYEAEDYHKNYFELNKVQPYCHIVISPKVEKFKKIYKERLKKD